MLFLVIPQIHYGDLQFLACFAMFANNTSCLKLHGLTGLANAFLSELVRSSAATTG